MAKATRICNVYEAYTLDGKPVTKGFADEVAAVLKCNPKSVGSYAENNNVVLKKWRIKKVGKATKLVENNVNYEREKKEKFDRYADINKYGNTCISIKEFERHKEIFEDKGYSVTYTKKRDRYGTYYRVDVV